MSSYSQQLMKGLSTWFEPKRIIVLIMIVLLCGALVYYSNSKTVSFEKMEDGSKPEAKQTVAEDTVLPSPVATDNSAMVSPSASPSDLLPNDANQQWTSLNNLNGANINMPDLLQAGNLIGLDTIGQTMKNANLQLRSDPIIVKQDVGPWNNSTYEADLGRVPLELGVGCR